MAYQRRHVAGWLVNRTPRDMTLRRSMALAVLCATFALAAPLTAQRGGTCTADTARSDSVIRRRLADWVAATNRGDRTTAREIWVPGFVGWFPTAPMFGDSAAFAAAGLRFDRTAAVAATFELTIAQVDVGGSMAAVHDIWMETRTLPGGNRVRREIRGSELWRCMADGQWRIARYVSAPEPWSAVK